MEAKIRKPGTIDRKLSKQEIMNLAGDDAESVILNPKYLKNGTG